MTKRDEPLWADVKIGFEILEANQAGPRTLVIEQPYGLIGPLADAQVRIGDASINPRNAYFHADTRGIFVVDFSPRSRIRFNSELAYFGWMRPGDVIELAGSFVQLSSLEISGQLVTPPRCTANMLAAGQGLDLCRVSLKSVGHRGASWILGSELVFVGRGDSCGIRLNNDDIAPIHCALFRASTHAYIIPLSGHSVQLNNESTTQAAQLQEGTIVGIGQSQFTARVSPPDANQTQIAATQDISRVIPDGLKDLPAFSNLAGLPSLDQQAFPLDLIPPESRDAVLGWLIGTLHAGQSEIIRRQNELQNSISLILKHLQSGSQPQLNDQSDKLKTLAAEVARLAAQQDTLSRTTSNHQISQDEPSRPAHDVPPLDADPAKSLETAAWLLEQMQKPGHDNAFSLKSWLSRRGREKTEPPQNGTSTQLSGQPTKKDDSKETS